MNMMRSRVATKDDPLRDHVQALRVVLDDRLGKPSDDRWFPRTFGSQLDVIAHLNRLLDASETREAILIDPFFGEEAIERLALRLTQTNLHLTVVASWGATDPDTGAQVPGDVGARQAEAQRRLGRIFARIGSQFAPRFRFLNLVTGSGSRAFHDRYLLLRPHTGPFRVFLLSNSVNNMAADWPFCISHLSGQARLEAERYIEGLGRGHDVTGSTNPSITFQWPAPADGEIAG